MTAFSLSNRPRSWMSLWLPVLLWAGVIFYLSSIPSLSTGWGVWDFVLRKIAHVTEFAVLTMLLQRAFGGTWPSAPGSILRSAVFFVAVLYAASDEFHQSFVPGRTASVVDVMIDTVGVILGTWIYPFIRRATART